MFCLNCTVCRYCNIVILGKILRSVRQKLIALYREYRYIEDRCIGVLSHTIYCSFCQDIAYLSLYRGYRYIEDRCIGVPLCISYFRNSYTKGCQPYIAQDRLVLRTTEWKVTHTAYREYKSLAFAWRKRRKNKATWISINDIETELLLV